MPPVTIKAHYDGERIILDEPFDLPPNSSLMVTLLPAATDRDDERAQWAAISARSLARAYSESEPDYTLIDLKQQS